MNNEALEQSIKRLEDQMVVLAAMEERHSKRLIDQNEELESLARSWMKLEAFRIRMEVESVEFRHRTEQNLAEITDKLNGLIGQIGGSNLGVKQ